MYVYKGRFHARVVLDLYGGGASQVSGGEAQALEWAFHTELKW
jgi:hypothetical protein